MVARDHGVSGNVDMTVVWFGVLVGHANFGFFKGGRAQLGLSFGVTEMGV